MTEAIKLDMSQFDPLVRMQVHTIGMSTIERVIGHNGRLTSYAALGDEPYTVKRIVETRGPAGSSEVVIELEQDKTPKDFKKAICKMSDFVNIFTLKHGNTPLHELVAMCTSQAILEGRENNPVQEPSQAQDGWGAWA